jgi:hypothetical protein
MSKEKKITVSRTSRIMDQRACSAIRGGGLRFRSADEISCIEQARQGGAYGAEIPHSINYVRVLSPKTGVFIWAKKTIESLVELGWIDELVGDGLGTPVALY